MIFTNESFPVPPLIVQCSLVDRKYGFLLGFLVKVSGTNHSNALMKGGSLRPKGKNLLPATRQAGRIGRPVPSLTGNVKQVDFFALIQSQLHGPHHPLRFTW